MAKYFRIGFGYAVVVAILTLIGRIIFPGATLWLDAVAFILGVLFFKVDEIEGSDYLFSFSIDFRFWPVAKNVEHESE